MFSALVREKWLLRPFVFNMFSALDTLSIGGQKVGMQFGGGKVRDMRIINSYLRGEPGDKARHSPRTAAGGLA
jgi:hypothetical protein